MPCFWTIRGLATATEQYGSSPRRAGQARSRVRTPGRELGDVICEEPERVANHYALQPSRKQQRGLECSAARSLLRTVTGASRSLGRLRGAEDVGDGPEASLAEYHRTNGQHKTVPKLLDVMTASEYLG
jgi:hypothetical protein